MTKLGEKLRKVIRNDNRKIREKTIIINKDGSHNEGIEHYDCPFQFKDRYEFVGLNFVGNKTFYDREWSIVYTIKYEGKRNYGGMRY